jgi:hypothetical protein
VIKCREGESPAPLPLYSEVYETSATEQICRGSFGCLRQLLGRITAWEVRRQIYIHQALGIPELNDKLAEEVFTAKQIHTVCIVKLDEGSLVWESLTLELELKQPRRPPVYSNRVTACDVGCFLLRVLSVQPQKFGIPNVEERRVSAGVNERD